MDAAALAQFKLFGYTVLRGLLSPAEVRQLTDEVTRAVEDIAGDALGTNTREDVSGDDIAALGTFVPLMADETPLSQRLVADDPRLPEIAQSILGEFTLASPALATCLVGDTPWHHDAGMGIEWVRVNAYLTTTTASSGALRIVPCSQHGDLPAELDKALDADWSRARPDSLPGAPIETSPGDVIVFDPRCHHGSWGATRRLRWSVDFASLPDAASTTARRQTSELIRELSDWPTTDRWPTWREWMSGATPARASAVRKLRELDVV